MRKLVAGLMVAGLAALAAAPAAAQVRFGANLSWGDDTDLGLGARLNFGLGDMSRNQPVEGLVTFDYFFPDAPAGTDVSYWSISGNAIYRFTTRSASVFPYAGGGLLIARGSVGFSPGLSGSDTDIGLSLVGGLRFRTAGTLLPFVEGRFELADGSQFVLSGGVYFGRP
jgi:hypothetical protein